MFDDLKQYFATRTEQSAVTGKAKQEAKATAKQDKLETFARLCRGEEARRWGPPRPETGDDIELCMTTRAVVHRYQRVLGIQHLADPYTNKKYPGLLRAGYFEPIPMAWAGDPYGPLTQRASSYQFDDAAEERLYWVLNNSVDRDAQGRIKPKPQVMKPDEFSGLRMANARMRTAVPIDKSFASDTDYFKTNKRYAKKGYSRQVPPLHISHAFEELFESQAKARELGGQGHATDEIDVMVLLDVSSSMGWEHQGFDQPRHVDVVHNILRRAVHHMEVRDSYANEGGAGVETITFSNFGTAIGKINWANFEQKWAQIQRLVQRGGGTQVMTGWNKVKNTHFEKHGGDGKAWKDPTFGWQATPAMAKLSLLVLLDGEARDMDEFELEILGEKWAYVTICLIGRENCPDHHRHANELTRISNANDHVQFLDVHGRICERLVVSDILKRVYASTAPSYSEIMDSHFELPSPQYTVVKQ